MTPLVRIRSPDGASLAVEVGGRGRPLVMVHGTGSDRSSFALVRGPLEREVTVMALDRRGRGASGDGGAYAIEREVEDVVAVVEAAGEGVALFGHSFGAVLALEAALRLPDLPALVLYEPTPGGALSTPELVERLEALLERGEREEALLDFLRHGSRLDEEEIAGLQASPAWGRRLAAVHTVPRELRAEAEWSLAPERFRATPTPTLMLLGARSPAWAAEATRAVAGALPDCRVVTLEGHGHTATVTAPELLAREVSGFLESRP